MTNSLGGDRPAVNREVHEACISLIRNDPRMFVRQLFNLTGGEDIVGGYDEEMVDGFLARVPLDLLLPFWETRTFEGERIGDRLAQVTAPMLLAQHKGCLLYTPEGFDDAGPHERVFELSLSVWRKTRLRPDHYIRKPARRENVRTVRI